MSELRDKATRLLLKSAWEMADDNEDELSAVFDGQHGFTDDLRRRAMIPWRVSAVCPVRRLTMMKWNV